MVEVARQLVKDEAECFINFAKIGIQTLGFIRFGVYLLIWIVEKIEGPSKNGLFNFIDSRGLALRAILRKCIHFKNNVIKIR